MTRRWLTLAAAAFLLCALLGDARKGDPEGFPAPGDAANVTAGVLGEQKAVEARQEPVKVGDGKSGDAEVGVGAGKKDEKGAGGLRDGEAGEGAGAKGEGGKEASGGDSSLSAVGTKDGAAHVEQCDAPNRCVDEKNKLIACLRVPGNDFGAGLVFYRLLPMVTI